MAQRQVRFYELLNAAEERMEQIDYEDLLDGVQKLPTNSAYVSLARLELLGSTYQPPKTGSGAAARIPLLILDRITREVRIRIENNRRYRPLELAPGETIAEPTHCALFDRNVVGLMRANGNSPGPASLRDYLNKLWPDAEVNIRPLANVDMLAALQDVERLTKIDLRVSPDASTSLVPNGSLRRVLQSARRDLGDVTIEVIIKVGPGNNTASDQLRGELQELVTGTGASALTKAQMTYRSMETGRAEAFDFLSEAVALDVEVDIADAGNGPTNPSASEGLARAYEQLRPLIARALT